MSLLMMKTLRHSPASFSQEGESIDGVQRCGAGKRTPNCKNVHVHALVHGAVGVGV